MIQIRSKCLNSNHGINCMLLKLLEQPIRLLVPELCLASRVHDLAINGQQIKALLLKHHGCSESYGITNAHSNGYNPIARDTATTTFNVNDKHNETLW